jgi:rare lipoprotein A
MRYLTFLLFLLGTSLSAQTVGSTATGLASYFADDYHGSKTGSGDIYNRNDLVAAHKLFDYNSIVKVTNLENDRSVSVRIIDRGPFIQGRIIEVSHRAAELLGMLGGSPTARVTIELVNEGTETGSSAVSKSTRPQIEEPTIAPPPAPNQRTEVDTRRTSPPPPAPKREETPKTYDKVVTPTQQSTQPSRAAKPVPTPAKAVEKPVTYRPAGNDPITSGNFGPGTYKVELREPGDGKYGVQIASLASLESAMQEVAKLQAKWFDNILIKRVDNTSGTIYKVILGPFTELDSAQRYNKDLAKRYKIKGFTTELK